MRRGAESLLSGRCPAAASLTAAALVAALALGACGGGSGAEPAAQVNGGKQSHGPTETLNVALVNNDAVFAPLYIAQRFGWYKAAGLNVKLQPVGANTIPQLVSGHSDLLVSGTSSAAVVTSQGKKAQILYSNAGGGISAYVAARGDIKSVKDCKRWGTASKGTSLFAWANSLKKLFGVDYPIRVLASPQAIGTGLATGSFDCANATYQVIAPYLDKGVHLIANPATGEGLPDDFPSQVSESAIMALQTTVIKRRDAVVRFLRAYRKAVDYMASTDAQKVADILLKSPDYATLNPEALQTGLKQQAWSLRPCEGFVPESIWDAELAWFAEADLGFDVTQPPYAYKNLVDMSPYEEATGEKTPSSCQPHR